jgi:alanine racemase
MIERNANVRHGVNRSSLFTGQTVSCLELLVANRDLELIKKYALQLAVDSQTYSSALKKAADLERNDVVIYLLSIGEEVLVKKK